MNIKRYIVTGLCLLSFSLFNGVWAQSTMTDEQIVQFVLSENEKGTNEQQIVAKLMQRGVTIEQLQRVREKYEKQQKGSVLGAKDLTGGGKEISRLRVNNGDKKDKNTKAKGNNQLREFQNDRSTSERRRRLMQNDKENDMLDELSFLLPDTIYYEDEAEKVKIFGHNIFNNKNLTFEPNMNIAIPQNYRLGPGDVVFVDVWGASQKSYSETISPEGVLSIEDFGPVNLGGLTVAEANARMRATLGQRFANSNVKLTVGQTKTIMVNVMGEVRAPGTYTLSAFASVFHALYMAGGPNEIGTLRNVKVYRNNRHLTDVDIYDYILNGRLKGNVRLADNDVIVVGPYDCLVNVAGKVKRPMFYEMRKNESVATLLDYAGGFAGDAYQKNVRLIRKENGEYSVYTIGEFERGTFKVADGDSLAVDSVIQRYRNMVEVKGAVYRPGMYQMDGAMGTVRQLIENADGLTDDAFKARAVLHRRKSDRTLEVVAVDVEGIMSGKSPDVPLKNEDVLFIPSLKDLQEERTLSVYGEVVYPGVYQYADNTSLEDLVLQAGGLKDAASLVKVDVARRIRNNKALTSDNVLARTYSFALKDGFVVEGKPGFVLEPFDEVYVRKSPGYVEQQHVTIEGEVAFSGTYTLEKKNLRLSDLVKNAGGLTREAYTQGARLERKMTEAEKLKQQSMLKLVMGGDSIDVRKLDLGDTRYIGINLDKALDNPGSNEWDVALENGDRLIIPQYTNVVSINGEVMYPNTVSYKEGAKLKYYINQAGGYGVKAKKDRVFVVNMNGTVTRVRSAKDIHPGAEIVVPTKPRRRGLSFTEIVSLGSTTASLGAIIVSLLK